MSSMYNNITLNPRKQKVVHFNRLKPAPAPAPATATPSPEVVILVPGQLAEPEGLPDGARELDGLEGDPPNLAPLNQVARDCNRDIPPPHAQVEPEDIQPVNIPPGPRRSGGILTGDAQVTLRCSGAQVLR